MAEPVDRATMEQGQLRPRQNRPPRAGRRNPRRENPPSTSAAASTSDDALPTSSHRSNRNRRHDGDRPVDSSLNPSASTFRPSNSRAKNVEREQTRQVNDSSHGAQSSNHNQPRNQKERNPNEGNWRNNVRSEPRPGQMEFKKVLEAKVPVEKRSRSILDPNADPESQRAKLEEQLSNGSYECMICCEEIRTTEFIWSCTNSWFQHIPSELHQYMGLLVDHSS